MNNTKRECLTWLNKALDDLKWSESSLEDDIYYGACFTAQQAAEKALKAFLLAKQGRFDKSHDLVKLIDDCAEYDPDFSKYREQAAKLTFYYIESRYPDISEMDKFTKEEAVEALNVAEEMVALVQDKFSGEKEKAFTTIEILVLVLTLIIFGTGSVVVWQNQSKVATPSLSPTVAPTQKNTKVTSEPTQSTEPTLTRSNQPASTVAPITPGQFSCKTDADCYDANGNPIGMCNVPCQDKAICQDGTCVRPMLNIPGIQ